MDWFNTAYWANNRGIYDVWRSIYPPLSFVFLDATSLPGCYLQSPFYARDCDWLARSTIYAFYLIDVALAWSCFRRLDRHTAPMRTIAIALRSEEHTSELQSLMRISYAVFCLKKKKTATTIL